MVVRILQRLIFALLFGTGAVEAQTAPPVAGFQQVPELAYRVAPDFFRVP